MSLASAGKQVTHVKALYRAQGASDCINQFLQKSLADLLENLDKQLSDFPIEYQREAWAQVLKFAANGRGAGE